MWDRLVPLVLLDPLVPLVLLVPLVPLVLLVFFNETWYLVGPAIPLNEGLASGAPAD